MPLLDLFSTSQTTRKHPHSNDRKNDKQVYDACMNNAPYFAYQIEGKKWGVVQGCCNNWNCPRCGQQRAKEEYGRIVVGAREIAKTETLYLFTTTCRGRELGLEDAENCYLEWSNRLLTRLRTQAIRSGRKWYYACVTERQKRQHPHSHYITNYCPTDAIFIEKGEGKYSYILGQWMAARHATLESYSLELACTECGLGCQYDLSKLQSVEAGSRYAAKYLFKAGIFETIWPKGWKRVRYSQTWPKFDRQPTGAFVLLASIDWLRLSRAALIITTQNDGVKKVCEAHLSRADVIIQ